MIKSLFSIVVALICSNAIAQIGTFDTDFFEGGNHIFFENPNVSPNTSVDEMIKDNDGNFLVCGQSSNSGSTNPAYIMKFSPNGQLIQSFGDNGVAFFPEDSPVSGNILSIKQLQNGNYVILTAFISGSPNSTTILLHEIDQNGALVQDFDNVAYNIPGVIFSMGMDVSPQGKIWVHFNKINLPNMFTTSANVYAVQFNQDGTLNTSFGNAGLIEFGEDESDERVFGITFDDGGNAYLSGSYRSGSGFGVLGEIFILALSPTGQVKSDFAQNGIYRFNDGVASYGSQSIVFKNSELVFCGFRFELNTGEKGIVGKLNSNGTPVSSFGSSGIAEFNSTDSNFTSLTIDNAGRIVTLGFLINSGTNNKDIIVAHYSNSGQLLTNFGSNGTTTPWDLNTNEDKPKKVLLTNDGLGIIAAGSGFSGTTGGGGTPDLQIGDYGFLLKYKYDNPSSVVFTENQLFQLYPNPAQNQITLLGDLSNVTNLQIFDVSGNLVESITFNHQSQTVDISHLSNGTYILQFDNSVFKKFVVSRK